MAKNKELSEAIKGQIILLNKQGLSQVKIAKLVKCSRKGVQTTLSRFKETGSLKSRCRPSRKRITSKREDRKLKMLILKNRRKTSNDLKNELIQGGAQEISAQTIRRRLQEMGLRGCKARKKPWLSEANRKQRLEWARNYSDWTCEDWEKVIWSDESNIEIFGTPGAVYVRRRPGEEYHPDCVLPTVKHGGGNIMVWGCMGAQGVGKAFICEGRLNSEKYIEVLDECLRPSATKIFGKTTRRGYYFQQDNVPCHKSHKTMEWFKTNNIKLLPWPPQSPDLNPIEHLWGY